MSHADTERGTRYPVLQSMPQVGGRQPVPQSYLDGATRFDQAMKQARHHAYSQAAASFVEASTLLRVPDDDPYVRGIQRCRELAYQNAWESFRAADQREQGRRVLGQAAVDDDDLKAMVEQLVQTP